MPPTGLVRKNLAVYASLILGGCAAQGAPSYVLFGSYFPAWILCALSGIAVAIAVRALMVATGLSGQLPLQLFICISCGTAAAAIGWLLWFGR